MIFTGFDYSVTVDKNGKHYKSGDVFGGIQIDDELRVKKIVFSEGYAKTTPFCKIRMVHYIDQNDRLWSIQYPCSCHTEVRKDHCKAEVEKRQLLLDKEVIEIVSYNVKLFQITYLPV